MLSVRCSLLTSPEADSTPDAQAHCPLPAVRASGECFQCETLRRLLKIFHRRKRKYAFYFLKSAEFRLASSAGGREEPTPLSTLQPPPPS